MNLNLMIVDDEPYICEGMVATLPWAEMDITVTGVAHNGKEALQKIEDSSVDILLTDIQMPVMDGLALSKAVLRHYPDIKIVVFSGYDEFEYAREALRLGVEDYLLKPVEIDKLLTLIKDVKKTIMEERQTKAEDENHLISELLLNCMFHISLSHEADALQKNWHNHYRLVSSSIINYDDVVQNMSRTERDTLKMDWKRVVANCHRDRHQQTVSVFSHENELITFCHHSDPFFLNEDSFKDACSCAAGVVPFSLQHAYSPLFKSLDDLQEAYETITGSFMEREKSLNADASKSRSEDQLDYLNYEQAAQRLGHSILGKNSAAILADTDELFQMILLDNLSLNEALKLLRHIQSFIKEQQAELKRYRALSLPALQLQDYVDLKIFNTTEALKRLFKEDMVTLVSSMPGENQNHWIIADVKNYMHKNYQKNIKATDVAENHFITPNYFSGLFKKETGQSFSEYLNDIRIHKAQELLLNTSNKVFEIAEYVGYREYKYFVQVFRKKLGMTPTEFRKRTFSKDHNFTD